MQENQSIEQKQEVIGAGTSAIVFRSIFEGKEVAVKKFANQSSFVRAREGHAFLAHNLDTAEAALLIPIQPMEQENAIMMPILNRDAWVVSLGNNNSTDRTHLSKNKIPKIPNFNAVVKRLLNAVQACGQRCVPIGPDVPFFTVDKNDHTLGYLYADTECVSLERQIGISDDEIPLQNIYWAAGALNLFLQELVEDPKNYLVRLHQEAVSQMNSCFSQNPYWKELLEQNFKWPTTGAGARIAWLLEQVKRNVVSSFGS